MFSLWPCYQISLNKSDISDKPIRSDFFGQLSKYTRYGIHDVLLGQLSSAPIDQTSSAHPTSAGKYALSALRLTRPDLHSSTIAGSYALPALVNTFSSLQSVCCHRLGLLLTDISHRGEQNAAGCNSGILTTVITKSCFSPFPLAIYSHTAKVSHNILESRMQLGAFQEQNSHHRP